VPDLLEAAEPDREILSWSLFGSAIRQLAQQVADSGFVPEAVGTLNVEFYTGVDAHLDEPVLLPPLLDIDAVTGSSVLVVDDVADSGKTLDLVLNLVAERVAIARTAVLYDKPRSVIRPDYCWRSTDRWIVFPWSQHPPVVANPLAATVRPAPDVHHTTRRSPCASPEPAPW
jgi:hypoxanthine phosphoribosyltransferase